MKLKDRTALVTGASRGIGRAIALALAEQGAAVAVNYRSRQEDAAAVVKEIETAGGRAVASAPTSPTRSRPPAWSRRPPASSAPSTSSSTTRAPATTASSTTRRRTPG